MSMPHVLVLGSKTMTHGHPTPDVQGARVDVVQAAEAAMEALRSQDYHFILADVSDYLPLERAMVADTAENVLNSICDGVFLIDSRGECTWQNAAASGYDQRVQQDAKWICKAAYPWFANLPANKRETQIYPLEFGDRYLELSVSPRRSRGERVCELVAVLRDASRNMKLQKKMEAIDLAGRTLTGFNKDELNRIPPPQRLEMLKARIAEISRQLLRFNNFTIRVIKPVDGSQSLECVIAEGLPADAVNLPLYVGAEGNGISGLVACTGQSYICKDAERDPHYAPGLVKAKSSLTVPLQLFDRIIGVYNIESSQPAAFNEEDQRFAEIFARYIAMALNILDLLVDERVVTKSAVADALVQELTPTLNDVYVELDHLIDSPEGGEVAEALLRIKSQIDLVRRVALNAASPESLVIGAGRLKARPQDACFRGLRVLIADDNPVFRTTLAAVFKGLDSCLTQVNDGAQAIQALESGEFDLVLSDINMPQADGYQVFSKARARQPNIPVVLMTGFGYDASHTLVRAAPEGLDATLYKPFKVDDMLDIARAAMEKHGFRPA